MTTSWSIPTVPPEARALAKVHVQFCFWRGVDPPRVLMKSCLLLSPTESRSFASLRMTNLVWDWPSLLRPHFLDFAFLGIFDDAGFGGVGNTLAKILSMFRNWR